MLTELRVRNLGVVDDLVLMFGPGMTAVTGETGAGKTMLVEAIRLLTGGRAEPHVVRSGADEATIEGRFVFGDEERTLTRVVPTEGRSRAYVDGRMVPLSSLSEVGAELVDLHGQHAHQALLGLGAQRDALDAFGKIDLQPLLSARRRLSDIEASIVGLGGDAQTREREVDLLRYQLDELDNAGLQDPHEDERLQEDAELLTDASTHRESAIALHSALSGDGAVVELLGVATKLASSSASLSDVETRIRAMLSEATDVAADVAAVIEVLQDDPDRLAAIQQRRQTLKQLGRKYGPSVPQMIEYRESTRARLSDLEGHEERLRELEAERDLAHRELDKAEALVSSARTKAAPKLAASVQQRLRGLALPNARFEISVSTTGAGDEVTFLLGPNPGMPLLPIAKAASGGELARSMLALRLSLLEDKNRVGIDRLGKASTSIFDEVDAGIGGEAAVAVGKALSSLAKAQDSQVLVVTHLPQVAAFADHQITVTKQQHQKQTVARAEVLDITEREIELARMLSGRPDSDSGRAHARELLQHASRNSPR